VAGAVDDSSVTSDVTRGSDFDGLRLAHASESVSVLLGGVIWERSEEPRGLLDRADPAGAGFVIDAHPKRLLKLHPSTGPFRVAAVTVASRCESSNPASAGHAHSRP
jgi:hypothetical protein